MKLQTKTLLPALTFTQVKELTAIVDETLDRVSGTKVLKGITAAELWRIQKSKRPISSRRFLIG